MKLKQIYKKHNIVATVISLVARQESRQTTVKSLEAFGLEPFVIESDPLDDARNDGNAFSNAQASVKAIEFALESKSNLLFCEDDIVFSKHFGVFVNWAAESENPITYFYAHDKVDRLRRLYSGTLPVLIKAKQKIEPQLLPFATNSYLPFTQCVLIKHEILQDLDLDELKKGESSFDIFLQSYIRSKKLTPYIALPHPVQHTINREGRNDDFNHSYKRSLSFVEADKLNV